ncbi:MAG TPA: STAS domain-containing protein [Gammaproteobacteria bacterium]|nr:STAS domain-containing protein [Gammaproteobacteria bacterium]
MVSCEVREQEGVAVIALSGDVDLESSPKVRDVLLDCVGAKRPVLVDMSGVAYIDSSGVASLVEAHQRARKVKTTFALAQVSQSAMRVLELARLDKVFTIHSSLADGLRNAG